MPVRPTLVLLTLALIGLPAAARADASGLHARGFSFGYTSGHEDPFQYALIEKGSMTTGAVSDRDRWRAVGDLQREVNASGRECLWFAIDQRSYVIRDAALLDRAHAILQPMNELGRQQGRLGAQQGELGRQQGELGRLQGRIGTLQGRVARLQAMRSDDDDVRAQLDDLQQQLRELGGQARMIGARQQELGARQRELGERQRELGEQQRIASARATRELRELARDAIDDGKAESFGD